MANRARNVLRTSHKQYLQLGPGITNIQKHKVGQEFFKLNHPRLPGIFSMKYLNPEIILCHNACIVIYFISILLLDYLFTHPTVCILKIKPQTTSAVQLQP